MTLEFAQLPHPRSGSVWYPFGRGQQTGFTSAWWDSPVASESRDLLFSATRDGYDVGRARLADPLNHHAYPAVPNLGPFHREIIFFEVRTDLRGHGIGGSFVGWLTDAEPRRRLIAEAREHRFWRHELGWDEYGPEGTARDGFRLFVQR